MDKLSDLFRDLKDRTTNPFFSSFIISWLVINWKVPVVLIFYKQPDLIADNATSYIQFISQIVTFQTGIMYPILFALSYVLIGSLVKIVLNAYIAKIQSLGTTWNLIVSGKGKVSMTRYVELKIELQKKEKVLEELLSTDGKFKEQNEALNKAVNETQVKNLELKSHVAKLKKYETFLVLNGIWNLRIVPSNSEALSLRIAMIDGKIHNDEITFTEANKEIGNILYFFCNPFTHTLCMRIQESRENGVIKNSVHFLRFNEKLSALEGSDNFNNQLRYVKIEDLQRESDLNSENLRETKPDQQLN